MANKFIAFMGRNRNVVFAVVGAIIVIGIIIGSIVVFWGQAPQSSEELEQNVEYETEKLTMDIGDKVDLPDETPIISIVIDKSQLEGDIFENAENGDKVLIYEKAKLMVVYRESTNEIIATGPVGTGSVEEENNIPAGVE